MTRRLGQRGSCLLCHYGLSIRQTTRARPYATFFQSTIRSRKPRNSTHQEEREERRLEKQLFRRDGGEERRGRFPRKPLVRGGRAAGATTVSRSVRLLRDDEPEDGQTNILHRLEKCFSLVWNPDSPHGAVDTRLLDDLDPTGERWNKHVDHIRQLFGMPASHFDAKQKQLYTDITKSLSSEDYNSATVRLLRYSFIDQALEDQGFSFHHIIDHVPDMQNPTEWYPSARAMQRQVHLHVGPTNSGKTYNALKKMEEADSGFYAGPLRLLAHEVYSRFLAKGIPCDLITGDDIRLNGDEDTVRTSSTVEMVSVTLSTDVAVIDEIQMIADDERGWAWTRALLGAQAREVHLCGEERVVPLIQELAATMGDNLQIHRYERLNPLKVTSRSLRGDLKNLRKGDCVVSFSVMGIHAMRRQIEKETGRRVAIVYGSLPPETRAKQAALFNDPDNDYDFLVASDAIGMGLNLSIKRIIFETVTKFNGISRERMSISQIKQIAGRAGRYRTARQDMAQTPGVDVSNTSQKDLDQKIVGLVTCLDEKDLPIIRDALSTEATPIKAAGILPPGQCLEEFSNRLPPGLPFEYLYDRVCKAATVHSRYKICDVRSQLRIARAIESVKGLSIQDRITFCGSPAESRSIGGDKVLQAFARCIAERKDVTLVDMPEIPLEILDEAPSFDRAYLSGLETLHKAVILYLWLGYRFTSVFKDMDMAFHAKELAEEKINICLTKFSANPKLRQRLEKMKGEHHLRLDTLEGGSESPEAEASEPTIGEGEVVLDDARVVAPMEDESTELGLAVEELEQLTEEPEGGDGELDEALAEEDDSDETLNVAPELGPKPCLSAEQEKAPRALAQASNSEEYLDAATTDEGRPDPTLHVIPDLERQASASSKASNDEVQPPEHEAQNEWTSPKEVRPVFIPTDNGPKRDDEVVNALR